MKLLLNHESINSPAARQQLAMIPEADPIRSCSALLLHLLKIDVVDAESSSAKKNANGSSSNLIVPGYGRARLWLGISGVGTIVTLCVLSLALNFPAYLTAAFKDSLNGQILALLVFLLIYAVVQFPFDLFGGYLLPKRFGRAHPPLVRYISGLLRGVVAHTLVLLLAGFALLLAGGWFGVPGVIAMGVIITVILLVIRKLLACFIAPIRLMGDMSSEFEDSTGEVIRAEVLKCADEGFTGGYTGVLHPQRVLIPAHWIDKLDTKNLSVIHQRRNLAVTTGACLRGRLLALGFTWTGITLSALLVGSEQLGSAEGIITLSLVFTLWSFLGLLMLPTPSRAGVAEVDAKLRVSGVDASLLNETIHLLDEFQDRETERPAGIETVFHPVPAVQNRIEVPVTKGRRGFLDAARTSVFLGASCLGLLGRAVHCNCGRPSLWIFLPSD